MGGSKGGRQSMMEKEEAGTSISFWLALGPVCVLASIVSLGVVVGHRHCPWPPPLLRRLLRRRSAASAASITSPLAFKEEPLRLAAAGPHLSPMLSPSRTDHPHSHVHHAFS